MTTCPWTPDVAASLGMPFTCATLDTPTTYRVRFADPPDALPAYRVICISKLGADYGDKGTAVPTCDEHDAASRTIQTLIAPPPAPMAPAIPGTATEMGIAGSWGRGTGETGWVIGIPGDSGTSPGRGAVPDPASPVSVSPVPLPGAIALLLAALVLMRRMAR